MSSNVLQTSVNLVNDKVQFTGVSRDNPAITMDYIPPIGDGQGYMPMELLLMSLAACSGTTVVSLLRRMGRNIKEFSVNAEGIKRDQHPMSFKVVKLEFILDSDNTGKDELQKAVKLSEETYCPVWAMLKNNVGIEWVCKIINIQE